MGSPERYNKSFVPASDQAHFLKDTSQLQYSSPKLKLLQENSSLRKLQEQRMHEKLPSPNLNKKITYKLPKTKGSDSPIKRRTDSEDQGHYYNQKYYEDKQQQVFK